jgi:hypothetical protein
MCDANSYIEGTIIEAEIDPNGYFWLSEGSGQSRYFRKYSSTNRAYPQEGCVNCPTPTPIPATNTPLPATNTPIPLSPTSTPIPDEPTATPVPPSSYTYRLGPSYITATQACTNFGMDFYIEAFAATSEITEVQQFFIDSGLNTLYTGENETHAFARMDGFSQVGLVYSGRISFLGQVSDKTFCAEQG